MAIIVSGLLIFAAVGSALFAWLGRGELNRRIKFLEDHLQGREAEFAAKKSELEAKLRHLEALRGIPDLLARSERQRAELAAQVARLEDQLGRQEAAASRQVADLIRELGQLHELRRIPNIMERAKRLELEVATRLDQARRRGEAIIASASTAAAETAREADRHREQARLAADSMLESARQEADRQKDQIIAAIERDGQLAHLARVNAEVLAQASVDDAKAEAKRIAAVARKEAKEKTQQVDERLNQATLAALSIRRQAEAEAQKIGGQAYEALRQHATYAAQALALKHRIEGYAASHPIPPEHVLDDLAYDYGFQKAGEKLKLARERVKIMERNGTAATCQYPDGWKKDYAIRFVLDAFNGQVDALLARIKPANHGRLAQEVRDTFALANRNGEVFRNACIQPEFLDARLDELKWGVAVQKLREQDREEQRALRERIKEEEKAARERARAVEQAEREQALIAKAIERARREHDTASAEDRERYEAQLRDLDAQLRAAEEKNRRAISMAQQTKQGHVYVISNVGSFGEDVYKIGLTRRLEPLERVHELGSASVPFAFDVHALIPAEDAPALEAALHARFRECQVNKVNRRKEFFRLKLHDIRAALDELKYEVRWTTTAEARDYRETLTLEEQMHGDPEFRRRWAESEAAYEAVAHDDDGELASADLPAAAVAPRPGATKRAGRQRQRQPAGKSSTSARPVDVGGALPI